MDLWIRVAQTDPRIGTDCTDPGIGTIRGSVQSVDRAAQSMDPRFARRSMDCPLNPLIAQTSELSMDLTKPWIDVRCFQREAESLHVCLFGFCGANKRTVCSNDGCMLLLPS